MTLDARKINPTYEDKFRLNYVHKCTILIRVYVDDKVVALASSRGLHESRAYAAVGVSLLAVH